MEQKRMFSIGNNLTIYKHNVVFSQAVRMGFEPVWGSSGRPTNKKPVTNSLNMEAVDITFECSFISLDISIAST